MYFTISFLYTPQYSHLRISAPGSISRYRYLFELMAGVEPATSSLPRMRSTTELHQQHELLFATTRKYECINKNRAENGAQTRDPQLGRLVLYRLSYFRVLNHDFRDGFFVCGSRWIRTTEGENQQIYSLPHLAALEYSQFLFQSSTFLEPLVGFEPTTPRLQITCSGQLS